jgi:hypothetical protein
VLAQQPPPVHLQALEEEVLPLHLAYHLLLMEVVFHRLVL